MTFQIGDVVKLKSGGPSMTIVSLPDREFTNAYHAIWFSGEKYEEHHFPPASLVLEETFE
jgi:uncharacterized protein YodC (DUF2158 family)